MPTSSGASSRAGRAAAYRERRVNRTVYALGLLLLLGPWLLWLMQLQAELNAGPRLVGTSVHAILRTSLEGFALGSQYPGFGVVAAACLAIALFAYDRALGGLFYSLSGPLRRRDVWTAKARYGGAAIVAAIAFGLAGTLGAAALSGNLALAGGILLRGLFEAAGQLSLFATALAMSGIMGTGLSCLATAVWAAAPSLLQGLLLQSLWSPVRLLPPAWLATLGQTVAAISPFQPQALALWPLAARLGLVAWFLAWAGLMAWLGPRWWEAAPFERLQDGVFFPFLWNFYYALLALVSGFLLVTLFTRGTLRGPAWVLAYGAVSVAGWFFWRWVVARQGRVGAWRQSLGARL